MAGVSTGVTMESPKFPKDDATVTRKKNLRSRSVLVPVVTCSSSKHWDYECKYSFKEAKAARVNHAQVSEEDILAEEIYELYAVYPKGY